MKRAIFIIVAATFLTAFAACGSGGGKEPATPEQAQPAAEQAQPAPAPQPAAPVEAAKPAPEAAAAQPAAAEPEGAEDPDDESWGGDGTVVDRDKLAKAYEEVYCAQKKNEMEKILDIYKNYGFEKPEDFISMWMEAAKDTGWVTKVAHDAASKCK